MSDEQHPTTYRVELDAPLEKGRRAVRAYDGDDLVLDGVLEPRRPSEPALAEVVMAQMPEGQERGEAACRQIEREANTIFPPNHADEEPCGNCGRVSANPWCCADGPHGLAKIAESVRLMRQRQESGQGTIASVMCRLSLPMAEELLHLARKRTAPPLDGWSSTPPPSGDMLVRDLADDGTAEWVELLRWVGPHWRWDRWGLKPEQWARDEFLMGWQFRPLNLDGPTGASSGGIAATMKPLGPDGEVEMLLAVDGRTASVWLSREWWEAATPATWKEPGAHQVAMVAIMARDRARIRQLAEAVDDGERNYLVHTLRSQAELWRRLRDVCQEQGHHDAGHEYEELATDCIRAVVDWQGAQ